MYYDDRIPSVNDFSETTLVFVTAIYSITVLSQWLYIFIHVHAHRESLLAIPTT